MTSTISEASERKHARVTTVEIDPDQLDAAIAAVHDHLVPDALKRAGLLGAYWFAERSESLLVRVDFFDTAERLRAARVDSATIYGGGHVKAIDGYELVADSGPAISPTAQFCRSLVWQEDPNQFDQAVRRVKEHVLPGVRSNIGFQAGFWLIDRVTGRSAGFTLWDTSENLHTSGQIGRQVRREPIQQGDMQVHSLHEYEIVARTPTR